MTLARLCACLGALLLSPAALAFPKLQLHPIELLGYVGDSLKIAVELPCGGTFYGLVARTDRRQGTLELAAAVVQGSIVCTSLPSATELVVDYIATSDFKVIASMPVPSPGRLLVARIRELRMVKSGASGTKLTAVHESRCGHSVGTLIHQTGKRKVELAFVERPSGVPAAEGCDAKPRKSVITALDLNAKIKVAALKDRPKSLARAFSLRLAEVRLDGAKTGQSGLTVGYKRGCNEAPVGVVVGRATKDGVGTTVKVGVLVARYYNFPCAVKKGETWASVTNADLRLPKAWRLQAVAASKAGDSLDLKTPTSFAKVKKGQGLSLKYIESCHDDEAFAVYTHDGRGKLAVGVLAREKAGSSHTCKVEPGEASLPQPLVARTVQAGELFPLKLKGS